MRKIEVDLNFKDMNRPENSFEVGKKISKDFFLDSQFKNVSN